MMNSDAVQRIKQKFVSRAQFDCPLKAYTSFGIGGNAAALLVTETAEELCWILNLTEEYDLPWQIIGKGSNLLVSDDGFDGLVLKLGTSFQRINVSENETIIEVGAGISLTKLIKWCQIRGLSCVEFLFGVPGSVGGAAVMNAGAFGGEIGGVLAGVELVNRQGVHFLGKDALAVSYRCFDSWEQFKGRAVITKVFLQCHPGDSDEISARCIEIAGWRRAKQPLGQPNAGSFFKNPPGDSAGRLIDAAGLKGVCVGGAQVSEKHANFLVNTGGAACGDVLELMQLVQAEVQRQFGVRLEPEVRII